MFWTYNNGPSPIETMLSKEDVSLREVMDDEDILNDCKIQNKVLIEYLMKKDVLRELVNLTVDEPPPDTDDMVRYKYSNIACEILTSDVSALSERLAGDADLLQKLYSFLEAEPPLNPLLASFFSKVMIVLIAKTTQQNWLSYQFTSLQVLDFLKAQENFLPQLLKHLNTSAIMDLTLKLMTAVEGAELKLSILKWLDEQMLIQSLIGLLRSSSGQDKHFNIAQLLCDFIKTSRDNLRNDKTEADPLLENLESSKTVSLLLDQILGDDTCDSAIIAGIQILITLLDINASNIPNVQQYTNSTFDEENNEEDRSRQAIVDQIKRAVILRLKDFHGLLLNPPKNNALSAYLPPPSAITPKPFGNARLHIVRLLVVLVRSPCDPLPQTLVHLDFARTLLDLFFAHPWNNFLHAQVEAFVAAALRYDSVAGGNGGSATVAAVGVSTPVVSVGVSAAGGGGEVDVGEEVVVDVGEVEKSGAPVGEGEGDHNALSKHLLLNCDLIERILFAWKMNDEKQREANGRRQGYMGHLINILNNVVNVCLDSKLGEFLKDNKPDVKESLELFKDTTLKETNDVQNIILGGVGPNQTSDGAEGVYDYNEVYADYQVQQLAPQMTEGFAFNDDDFKDGNALPHIEHRGTLNFDLSEGELMLQQHELFKQVCGQNISTLDDADDQIFEEREHDTFQTVIEKGGGGGGPAASASAGSPGGGGGGADLAGGAEGEDEVGSRRRRRRNKNSSSSSSSGSGSGGSSDEEGVGGAGGGGGEGVKFGGKESSSSFAAVMGNEPWPPLKRTATSSPPPPGLTATATTTTMDDPWAGTAPTATFTTEAVAPSATAAAAVDGWANFTAAFNEHFEPVTAATPPPQPQPQPLPRTEVPQGGAKVIDAGDLRLESVEDGELTEGDVTVGEGVIVTKMEVDESAAVVVGEQEMEVECGVERKATVGDDSSKALTTNEQTDSKPVAIEPKQSVKPEEPKETV